MCFGGKTKAGECVTEGYQLRRKWVYTCGRARNLSLGIAAPELFSLDGIFSESLEGSAASDRLRAAAGCHPQGICQEGHDGGLESLRTANTGEQHRAVARRTDDCGRLIAGGRPEKPRKFYLNHRGSFTR
eukprot:scaffold613_cov243-Pinguiococcus_pyrenoidosus.AAC.13